MEGASEWTKVLERPVHEVLFVRARSGVQGAGAEQRSRAVGGRVVQSDSRRPPGLPAARRWLIPNSGHQHSTLAPKRFAIFRRHACSSTRRLEKRIRWTSKTVPCHPMNGWNALFYELRIQFSWPFSTCQRNLG